MITEKSKESVVRTLSKDDKKIMKYVQPLTNKQLRLYSVQCAVPMIGFGLMDNTIMIFVGDLIDGYFGMYFKS